MASPMATAASIKNNKLTLTLDSSLDKKATVPADLFSLQADGETIEVSRVQISKNKVMLFTNDKVAGGIDVSLSYNDPSTDDDTSVLQGEDGSDVASFTLDVTNQGKAKKSSKTDDTTDDSTDDSTGDSSGSGSAGKAKATNITKKLASIYDKKALELDAGKGAYNYELNMEDVSLKVYKSVTIENFGADDSFTATGLSYNPMVTNYTYSRTDPSATFMAGATMVTVVFEGVNPDQTLLTSLSGFNALSVGDIYAYG